jgi:hypothetical protein
MEGSWKRNAFVGCRSVGGGEREVLVGSGRRGNKYNGGMCVVNKGRLCLSVDRRKSKAVLGCG